MRVVEEAGIMKAVSLRERVHQHYGELTPALRRIADFVLADGSRIAFMTARELAAATQASDAAVVRFARALGFDGLPELRDLLRTELLGETQPAGSRPGRKSVSAIETATRNLGALQQRLLDETRELNDWRAFERVAVRLAAARRIGISGHGMTFPLAVYLTMALNELLGNAETLSAGAGDLHMRMATLSEADVVVGIGYPRYQKLTIEVLEAARERGAVTVAITDGPASPLAFADELLLVARANFGLSRSQIGTMAVCDALAATVGLLCAERVSATRTSSEGLLRRFGLLSEEGEA